MSAADQDLLSAFDGHDIESIRTALNAGANPSCPIRGKLPVNWLLERYARSDRLPDCLRLLFANGAVLPDPFVIPVLLDDPEAIRVAVGASPSMLNHRTTLVSSFTSLVGVSLLHVAAEYGNLNAARALIDLGVDVNATAEVSEQGLNGHTPLFHTVNSNENRSASIMRLLLAANAKTDVHLTGIEWGKGYEWETICFNVTPVSYAQMGLLPQFHRNEQDIYGNIRLLHEAAGCATPTLNNVPNRYLRQKHA